MNVKLEDYINHQKLKSSYITDNKKEAKQKVTNQIMEVRKAVDELEQKIHEEIDMEY